MAPAIVERKTKMNKEVAIKEFLKDLALWNTDDSSSDIDDVPGSMTESDVVVTHEPRSNFIIDKGLVEKYNFFKADGHQKAPGRRRGTIFVRDCGDFRLVASTAE